ncbi:MAG: hypothetical protein CMH54_07810 [Myxococcales bacterium]|nr:hypothetical protein [Myxococcales bacterium]
MSRPTTIDTNEILETARTLFLKRGFTVSTAEIARTAGISEGSLFNRFPSKEKLFLASMDLPTFDVDNFLGEKTEANELEANLNVLAVGLLDFLRIRLPRVMMLKSNPIETIRSNPAAGPEEVLHGVKNYLEREIKLGRMENCDSEVFARMLIGSMVNYVFFELLSERRHSQEETRTYTEGVVSVLLYGVESR